MINKWDLTKKFVFDSIVKSILLLYFVLSVALTIDCIKNGTRCECVKSIIAFLVICLAVITSYLIIKMLIVFVKKKSQTLFPPPKKPQVRKQSDSTWHKKNPEIG